MPTAVPDTGHGSSITFGTTGGTWKVLSYDNNLEYSLPRVKTSYMATSSVDAYMPGDLRDHQPITVKVLFQGTQGLPAMGTVETITVTFPIPGGGAVSAATIAGTGFIMGVKYPPLRTNELQIGEITFTFDGGTGPTWTAAA